MRAGQDVVLAEYRHDTGIVLGGPPNVGRRRRPLTPPSVKNVFVLVVQLELVVNRGINLQITISPA
jgi:hypothetical protein